jgi:hypothetical protein
MLLHGREPVLFKKIVKIMEIFEAKLCVHDHAAEQGMVTPQLN